MTCMVGYGGGPPRCLNKVMRRRFLTPNKRPTPFPLKKTTIKQSPAEKPRSLNSHAKTVNYPFPQSLSLHPFMSTTSFRRRIPAVSSSTNHHTRHNLSQSPHRRTPSTNRPPSKPSIFTRCSSEPNLWTTAATTSPAADRTFSSEKEGDEVVIFRPHTFSEAFGSSPMLIPSTDQLLEDYKKDAKVVINVTVEGSPGPVRAMVKLGSNVDDTIKLVVAKYVEEGRTPKLEPTTSPSSFELHRSYFSLQSLDRRDIIGEVGSRSFYLRKIHGGESSTTSTRGITKETMDDVALPIPPGFLLSSFIARKMSKIVRRTRKLWNFIVCLK